MDRSLDQLHLLGDQIFYPCQNARNLLLTPQIRNYAPGTQPELHIRPEEADLYRHFPVLLLEYRQRSGYTANARSVVNTFYSMRFALNGKVTSMHPALMLQLAKYYMSKQLQQSDIRTDVMIKSTVFTGDPRLRSVPVVDCISRRYTKLAAVTMAPCKARGCSTPDEAINPLSEFVMSAPMCSSCIQRCFYGDMSRWVSLEHAKRIFSPAMLEDTVGKWCNMPLRYIFIGMVLEKHSKTKTLKEYEAIGRHFQTCPADVVFARWPYGKADVHYLMEMCEPLAWRQLYGIWKYSGQFNGKQLMQALTDDNFMFFGWSILPKGTKSIDPFAVGPHLLSIDGPDNPPEPYPLRDLRIPSKAFTRRIIMRGSTYYVWRRILHGFRMSITATSVDYEPNHHDVAVDANEPLDWDQLKSVPGDIAIFHAERLSYGSLARVMTLMKDDVTLHLYGSILESIAGRVNKRPIKEGVFAELVFTVRYFELNALSAGIVAVKVKPPGPELVPLCTEVTAKQIDDLSMESNLLQQRLPVPTFPKSIARDPAWALRLRMPVLLQQMNHVLMRDVQLPLVYVQPLMPRFKRRKISMNSLVQ